MNKLLISKIPVIRKLKQATSDPITTKQGLVSFWFWLLFLRHNMYIVIMSGTIKNNKQTD